MTVDRPLTIAEIFDRAVSLVVRRFLAVLILGGIVALPDLIGGIAQVTVPHFNAGIALPLRLAGTLLSVAVMAALTMLFAQDDDRPNAFALFRAAWGEYGRLFAASFVAGMVTILILFGGGIAVAIFAWSGPIGMGIVGAIVAAFLLIPLFASQQAFFIAVLERTRAWASVRVAFDRAMRPGMRGRAWALAFFVAVTYLGPFFVLAGVQPLVVRIPWIGPVLEALVTVVTLALLCATMTVAALDYRVRAEGTDLRAAIDASARA